MKSRSYHQSLCIFIITVTFSNIVVAQNASITINENKKIPEILALKKNLEAENKLAVGYTIQLYYGELSDANKIIKEYRNNFDSWPASIEYETPNYKVWVGSFSSRFEADRARLEIKDKFPAAFILKPDRS
tara:strand:+ start:11968 stop:12360 length:393 start_codon:yes stop_codon:yes gene_type:complete